MKIYQSKTIMNGTDDKETLFVDWLDKKTLRATFYNWGQMVEKQFGVEEVEHIYEIRGKKVFQLYFRFLLKKYLFGRIFPIVDLDDFCLKTGYFRITLVWSTNTPKNTNIKIFSHKIQSRDGNHAIYKKGKKYYVSHDNHKDLKIWKFDLPERISEEKLFTEFKARINKDDGRYFFIWLEDQKIGLEEHGWY